MSIRNLHRMFAPRSVAVIGPSTKPQSVGAALMRSLLQTPSSSVPFAAADVEAAKAIIHEVLADGREWLDPAEVAAFLRCYDVPAARAEAVADAAAAARLAEEIKGPVALKIRSRDVVHKSDVGGVVLNLVGPTEVAAAADRMISRISETLPHAHLEEFIVQEMVTRPGSYEGSPVLRQIQHLVR